MEEFRKLEDNFEVNQIYAQWFRKYVKIDDADDSSKDFADFYECVQVTYICTCTCTCNCRFVPAARLSARRLALS
jgi:hypothetical protein